MILHPRVVSAGRTGVEVWTLVCALVLAAGMGAALVAPPPGTAGRSVLAAATPVASPEAEQSLEILGLVERPGALGLDDLRGLPQATVTTEYETSRGRERHAYTGVRLYDVLQHVGVVPEPGDRTPLLRRYLVVTAKDGYRVVLSGGEIDPDFGDVPLLLAWERDGKPLPPEEGPLELVAPGDRLVSRYVWGVVRIDVLGIESAPEAGE